MVHLYGRVVREDERGITFDLAATIDGGTRGRVLFARSCVRRAGNKSGWDVLAVTRDALCQLRQGFTYVDGHQEQNQKENLVQET